MRSIDCYLTLNSPWTYLGSARLLAMRERHGIAVDVKPARFGEVFAKTGGLPLAKRAPERRAYRMMELKRWRDHLKIPIVLEPKFFPADEVAATRFLLAARAMKLDALRLSSELGRAVWEREENIAEAPVIMAAAARAGIDADRVCAAAPSEAELDRQWDALTAEALSRGVFGAPSYVLADGEFFWGQDRLEFLDRALAAGR